MNFFVVILLWQQNHVLKYELFRCNIVVAAKSRVKI